MMALGKTILCKMKESVYIMDKVQLLANEYTNVSDNAGRYLDYMYRSISISMVFFTTVGLYGLGSGIEYFAKELIFLYIIPIFAYIFGLIYAYNIEALAKIGYILVKLEIELRIHTYIGTKEDIYLGHVAYGKRINLGYVLSYGTVLALYIILPIFSVFIGIKHIDKTKEIFTNNNIIEALLVNYIPFIFYFIYFIFIGVIITEIAGIMNSTKKIKKGWSLDGTSIVSYYSTKRRTEK